MLDRVIVELPPIYRAVVLLRDMEELSTEETAQILDLSTDVVKTRLHRGRAAPCGRSWTATSTTTAWKTSPAPIRRR